MAKKAATAAKKTAAAAKTAGVDLSADATVVKKTPARNSAVPKIVAAANPVADKAEISADAIAKRAYEIHLSGSGGSEQDNWFRAERELMGL